MDADLNNSARPHAGASACDGEAAMLAGWIQQRGGADGAFAGLLSNPRLSQAVRAFAQNMRTVAASDSALDCIFKDAGRYVVAMCALNLHLTGELSLPRLKTMGAVMTYVSPGRARAVLQLLCHLEFLRAAPAGRRGDPVRYVPTDRFVAAWCDHLSAALQAIRIIEPSVACVLDRLDEPAVFETFCRRHAEEAFMEVREGHQATAFVRVFLHRYAGTQILWDLFLTEKVDEFPPRGPIPVSLTATARRHGVSRIHVRRLLDAGVEGGLLRYVGDREIVLEEAAHAAIRFVYAAQFMTLIVAAARTAAGFNAPLSDKNGPSGEAAGTQINNVRSPTAPIPA